eukprot:5961122-Pyramimonas_sp.AAC.1
MMTYAVVVLCARDAGNIYTLEQPYFDASNTAAPRITFVEPVGDDELGAAGNGVRGDAMEQKARGHRSGKAFRPPAPARWMDA